MSMTYSIAVLNCNKDLKAEDLQANLLSKLSDATVYSACGNGEPFPDSADSLPKKINWTIQQERAKPSHARYLHVVLDSVKLNADPKPFLDELAKMMSALKLQSWLNTACDPMNYVYKKYCPLMDVEFGEDSAFAGTKKLIFTSHANMCWSCYDLDAPADSVKLNEDFTFPMYYIVEFLARRRSCSNGKCLDFMNMYPTISSEKGLFEVAVHDKQEVAKETIEKENAAFRQLGLDVAPTKNVDEVLERLYNIINSNKEGNS